MAILALQGMADAANTNHSRDLLWLDLAPNADLSTLRADIEQAGGAIVTLAPEGRLLLRGLPVDRLPMHGITGMAPFERPVSEPVPQQKSAQEGTGWGRSKAKNRKALEEVCTRVTAIEPNDLARARAALEGLEDRPSAVDNSLSKYFPYIGNQYSQGSCTTWAACFYWNSYTHAMDEDLDLDDYIDNSDHISSPAFLYNLMVQDPVNGGSDILDVMSGMRDIGCCSYTRMPVDYSDQYTWPEEAAWIDALRRRTGPCKVIGTEAGCTDADLEFIKQYLANGHITVVGMPVFTSWSGWSGEDSGAFNNGVLYADSGTYRTGHGMAIVGYNDNRPYVVGGETRHGAFLLVNQWGRAWGVNHQDNAKWSLGNKGYMWVSYDYFKTANEGHDDLLGMAFFNEDRDNYRPQLFAVTGLDHEHRGELTCRAGIGSTSSPDWISHVPFAPTAYLNMAITGEKRIAMDLSDGIPMIADHGNISVFCTLSVDSASTFDGSIGSADFLHDFAGIGVYQTAPSSDPVVTVAPGGTGYATLVFAPEGLSISPGSTFDVVIEDTAPESFVAAGPAGGPFTSEHTYTLTNTQATALNWSVSSTAFWLTLSSAGGTLAASENTHIGASVTSAANALPSGTYDGTLTFRNESSGISHLRTVQLEVRPLHAFAMEILPAAGPPELMRNIGISALDIEGSKISLFESGVSLTARTQIGQTHIGDHQGEWTVPLYAYWRNARVQSIYLSEDLGEAGLFTALSLSLTHIPGETLKNWTIRLKHTTRDGVGGFSWDNAGWTTVYRKHETIAHTGCVPFVFDTPFAYNGVDNLMIDFSFSDMDERGASGFAHYTNTNFNRTINAGNLIEGDDPLAWTEENGPQQYQNKAVPDITLERGAEIPFTPNSSENFTDGAWNGTLLLPHTSNTLYLIAHDGNGHYGVSGPLQSRYGTDGDNDGLTYENETRDLDHDMPGTQNPFDPDVADATGDYGQCTPDGVPDGQNDFDGDGMPNSLEFALDTDPLDPESYVELPLSATTRRMLAVLLGMAGIGAAHAKRRKRALSRV